MKAAEMPDHFSVPPDARARMTMLFGTRPNADEIISPRSTGTGVSSLTANSSSASEDSVAADRPAVRAEIA